MNRGLRLSACNSQSSSAIAKNGLVSVADITQNLESYIGQSVLVRNYENQPAIIAELLILSPDPENLSQNPEAFYGQELAVKGELEVLKSYGVFELDEEQAFGGEDLVIVQPKPNSKK